MLRLEIDLERLHDPHTMSKSTDIRTLRSRATSIRTRSGPLVFYVFHYSDAM